ncbi:hypothetical protein [Aliarcobacter cryaerophilus]|uniref:Uncharacterized protein n=1 Tax=Aliarcobacter cryaerophilus TaxID=28198 RepID=A0AA46N647_9BACT|nr:hypothetical protein [Aliarcobacter cryaerophilus]UYF42540.1 hypothetical protein NGX11_06410 [Aliarcobacter cryaerophilus]
MIFELIIYFTDTHYSIQSIEANNYEEAELKAYKKNASRTIQKIEPYFKKGREYVN